MAKSRPDRGAGGRNLYAYLGNCPINGVDALGHGLYPVESWAEPMPSWEHLLNAIAEDMNTGPAFVDFSMGYDPLGADASGGSISFSGDGGQDGGICFSGGVRNYVPPATPRVEMDPATQWAVIIAITIATEGLGDIIAAEELAAAEGTASISTRYAVEAQGASAEA